MLPQEAGRSSVGEIRKGRVRIGNSQFTTNRVKWVDARLVRRPMIRFLPNHYQSGRDNSSVQIP